MSDARMLRLLDLKPNEGVQVTCPCGSLVVFPHGYLQRRHRMRSGTLIFDLQFRLRCKRCGRRSGFRISVTDLAHAGDNRMVRHERVVVDGE